MTPRFDPQAIFQRLYEAGVRHVIIGGWAVNAHGHRRFTGDIDICPDPSPENLERLAGLLAELNARQLGLDEFDARELPGDPTNPRSLAAGGNFRTETDIGTLDIMQWVPGANDELGYARLAEDAVGAEVFGTPVTICSLPALLEMKRAAGRPQDLEDLHALQALED
jgi:hypothetical protein